MTRWTPGDPCLVIELNGVNRQPKRGGAVISATVQKVGAKYVQARLETGMVLQFWIRTGLRAHDGDFKWKLVPAGRGRRGGRKE